MSMEFHQINDPAEIPDGRELEPIEPLRTWPDECPHRELAVTGIPAVFKCLECDEKIPAPELAETRPLHAVD